MSPYAIIAYTAFFRMKEDVDKTIPLKEETIITVELSSVQKTYYKAILDKNREFLYRGVSATSNVPSLVNVMMELRKCCLMSSRDLAEPWKTTQFICVQPSTSLRLYKYRKYSVTRGG